jgi:hypothetical protein
VPRRQRLLLVVRCQLQHRLPQHRVLRCHLRGQLSVQLPERRSLRGPGRPWKQHRLHHRHHLCGRMPRALPSFLHQCRPLRCDLPDRGVPNSMRQWPVGLWFLLGKGASTR